MADAPQNPVPPTPPGDVSSQMRKSTGKVQPKKETVRINLPPKPSAAPTIKLPTLPPGGPTGAATAAPGAPRPAPPRAAAPIAQPQQQRGAAPAIARPVPMVATVSTVDKILAIAAAVMALAAVGTTVWMLMMLNSAVTQ